MSWFLFVIGNTDSSFNQRFTEIAKSASVNLEKQYFRMIAATENSNLTYHTSESLSNGWVLAGNPIVNYLNSYRFAKKKDIQKTFDDNNSDFSNYNGHFVIAKWEGSELQIISDSLRTRSCFIFKCYEYIIISTELDLIIKLLDGAELDFSVFSSRWLLENQFDYQSIIKGTRREFNCKISLNSYIIESNEFQEDYKLNTSFNIDDLDGLLSRITLFPLEEGKKLSVALSGGMDSRLVAAYTLPIYENVEYFSLGDEKHPDVQMAGKILQKYGRKHTVYNESLEKAESLIEPLTEFVVKMQAATKCSEFLNKRHFPLLSEQNSVIIDGGFAEILRFAHFNKLFYFGFKAFQNRDCEQLYKLLKLHRASFFIKEIQTKLEANCFKVIMSLCDDFHLHKIKTKREFRYWLELIFIKFKISNFCGFEQARVDNFVQSYTPFQQKDLIDLAINLDYNAKTNSKAVKQIIKMRCPQLAKFPLVRLNTTLPYSFNIFSSKVLLKAKQKMNIGYKSNKVKELLYLLKPIVMERINSADFNNTSYYDKIKIKNFVNMYYSGFEQEQNNLDWWFAFDLFANSLKIR